MTRVDVSYFYWNAKQGYRVRAWQAPAEGRDFGTILFETFARTEAAARRAAEKLAAQYGVQVSH